MITKNNKGGFTLVEMLVVILIMSILSRIGVNAFTNAQKSAKRTKSRENCRQLVMAWIAFVDTERAFPDEDDFSDSVSDGFYAATAENIGERLNTQYNKKGKKVGSTKYLELSKEECNETSPGSFSGTGLLDEWGNLILFTLDFDGDTKIDSIPTRSGEITATAYSYATVGESNPSKYVEAHQ